MSHSSTTADNLPFAAVRGALKAAETSGRTDVVQEIFAPLSGLGLLPWKAGECVEAGNALMRLKLFALADLPFAAMRERWPGDPVGWRGGALVATQRGQWERACALWAESLARSPAAAHQAWWWASYAETLTKVGRVADATAVHATLRERWSDDPAGWRGGAALSARAGDWQAASDLCAAFLARTPPDAQPSWAWVSHGDALLKLKRPEEASAAFGTVRERWPAESRGWTGGAAAAGKLSHWDDAAELWRAVLDRTPEAGQPLWWWTSYAEAQLHRKNTEGAGRAYAVLRARWPGEATGWRGGARLIAARQGWRHAARFLEDGLGATSIANAPELNAELILALMRAGRPQEARARAAAFHDARPGDARCLALEVETARLDGDARRALAALRHWHHREALKQFRPSQLATIIHAVGLAPAEAVALLGGWLGSEAAWDHLAPLYLPLRTGRDDLATVQAAPAAGLRRPDARQQLRGKLAQFLSDRSYPAFEAMVLGNVGTLDEAGMRKLLRLAEARFPNSRMALQLKSCLGGGIPSLSPEENAFAFPWRIVLPNSDTSLIGQLAGRPWRRLVCAVMVRDEEEMLPAFVAHYRALGVESFIVIDDGSAIDPADVLRDQSGVEITVIRARGEFVATRHGMYWINEIMESSLCDWLLFVDCDEHLLFPGSGEVKLPQFLDHLDSRGETAVHAPMVDVFDEGFASGGAISGRIQDHRLFAAELRRERTLFPPWHAVSGGVRGHEIYLTKTPLVKASAGVRYLTNHHVSECRSSATTAALVHLKIFRDRELFAVSPGEVMLHSRVRHRGLVCVKRHVDMAQLRMEPGAGQAFHAPLSPQRLLQLGYMAADPDWRKSIGYPLPRDRMSPALAVHRRSLAALPHLSRMTLGELPLADVLRQLHWAAASGSRADLRLLLSAHVSRIGPREVALALLLFTAEVLGKDVVARRLLDSLLARLEADPAGFRIHPVTRIALALDPGRSACGPLLDAMWAQGEAPPEVNHLRSLARIWRGEYRSSLEILQKGDPLRDDRSMQLYLRTLQGLREWDLYGEVLSTAIDMGRVQPQRQLLVHINIYPNAGRRQELLARFRALMDPSAPDYKAEAMSVYLAVTHLLGRHDDFETLYDSYLDRLPVPSRRFFDRMRAAARGAPPVNRAWGIGLSKTGTTSLHEFCARAGLASAHWLNPILITLLDRRDGDLFDFICDSTVTALARRDGVPPGRKVIATTRNYASWSRSFMLHFQQTFGAPGISFEAMQDILYGKAMTAWGRQWHEIHHELYFRFRSLAESYDYHHEWLRTLARERGDDYLELPIEAPNAEKVAVVRRVLGIEGGPVDYPHANRAVAANW